MVESSIVEILNPMTTSGNHTYDELAHTQDVGNLYRYGIVCNCRTNFSLTNPEYTSLIFLSYYPEFTSLVKEKEPTEEDPTPAPPPYLDLFNTYANMGNHILNARKFGETTWDFLMSSFIAHYMALTFQRIAAINNNTVPQSDPNYSQTLISAISNQSVGLATKESLGGEEIQIENMINVGINKDAGEFLTTPYGRAFWNTYISYAKNFFRGVY